MKKQEPYKDTMYGLWWYTCYKCNKPVKTDSCWFYPKTNKQYHFACLEEVKSKQKTNE